MMDGMDEWDGSRGLKSEKARAEQRCMNMEYGRNGGDLTRWKNNDLDYKRRGKEKFFFFF